MKGCINQMKKTRKTIAAVLGATMLLGVAAAPVSGFAAEAGELDVAVISDIQYQAGAADADGLILSKSEAMLDAAIAKINASNPEAVMVTGDLTNDGSEASHTYVAGKLAAMNDADTKVYVIPGEKDVAKSGVNAAAVGDARFAEIYADFGYTGSTRDTATLSYVAAPKAGYKLLMLDSVANAAGESAANKGRGEIDPTWALAQLTGNTDVVMAAAHHPSVSRGSVDSTLIDLVSTVSNIKDGNGDNMYPGDAFDGLDIVNKSAFPIEDMKVLSDVGVANIYTGHNYMLNSAEGTSDTTAWTDHNVGSLVAASAAVTYTTYNKVAATADTTVDKITTFAGAEASVHDLVFDAQMAYTPAMVDSMIDQLMIIYPRLVEIFRVIAPKAIEGLDFGSGIGGSITASVAIPAVKNLATDVLNILADTERIKTVIHEVKDYFLATYVGDYDMVHVLSDVAIQLQEDNGMVAPSLRALVDGLKADPADISIASAAVVDFATIFEGTETLDLLNDILDQNLTLKVVISESHTIRELLYGPVKYFSGLATVDLWSILDGIQPGVAPEDKPSAVAKHLVVGALMTSDGGTQTLEGLKAGVIDKADDLVNLLLRFGIQDII